MHMQNLIELILFFHKILRENEILTIIKGLSVFKICENWHNLDLVKVNAYAKFYQIPSICSQDIERKRNSEVNKGL